MTCADSRNNLQDVLAVVLQSAIRHPSTELYRCDIRVRLVEAERVEQGRRDTAGHLWDRPTIDQ